MTEIICLDYRPWMCRLLGTWYVAMVKPQDMVVPLSQEPLTAAAAETAEPVAPMKVHRKKERLWRTAVVHKHQRNQTKPICYFFPKRFIHSNPKHFLPQNLRRSPVCWACSNVPSSTSWPTRRRGGAARWSRRTRWRRWTRWDPTPGVWSCRRRSGGRQGGFLGS